MNISSNNNVSFKARCPQIRDADWVCRRVNNVFPCFSITRFQPMFIRHFERTLPNESTDPIITIYHLPEVLEGVKLAKQDVGSLFPQQQITAEQQKKLQLLEKIKTLIENFEKLQHGYPKLSARENAYKLIAEHKIGNCAEMAVLTKLVLRLNGFKNVEVASFYDALSDRLINHAFCIFNVDGSKITSGQRSKAIIVDTWAGKVDFVENMLTYYKNHFQKEFLIPQCRDLTIVVPDYINGKTVPKKHGFSREECRMLMHPKHQKKQTKLSVSGFWDYIRQFFSTIRNKKDA